MFLFFEYLLLIIGWEICLSASDLIQNRIYLSEGSHPLKKPTIKDLSTDVAHHSRIFTFPLGTNSREFIYSIESQRTEISKGDVNSKNVINPHKTVQEHIEEQKIGQKRKQSLKVMTPTNRKKFLSQTEKQSNFLSQQKFLIPMLEKTKSEITILKSVLPDYYSMNSRIKPFIEEKNKVNPKAINYKANPRKSQPNFSHNYIQPLNENTFEANDESLIRRGQPSNISFVPRSVIIDPNIGEVLTSDSQFSDESQDLDFNNNDSDDYQFYQIPRSVVSTTAGPLPLDDGEYTPSETKLKEGTISDSYEEEYNKDLNDSCQLKPLLEQLVQRLNFFKFLITKQIKKPIGSTYF